MYIDYMCERTLLNKYSGYILIPDQHIRCGYSLEASQGDASNKL